LPLTAPPLVAQSSSPQVCGYFDVRRTAAVLNLQTVQRKSEERELRMAA
jgi:hypothetical protein